MATKTKNNRRRLSQTSSRQIDTMVSNMKSKIPVLLLSCCFMVANASKLSGPTTERIASLHSLGSAFQRRVGGTRSQSLAANGSVNEGRHSSRSRQNVLCFSSYHFAIKNYKKSYRSNPRAVHNVFAIPRSPLDKQWTATHYCCDIALSVSTSSNNIENGKKGKNRPNDADVKTNNYNKNDKKTRVGKSAIDDLVRGIGLVPVESANSEKKRKSKTNNKNNQEDNAAKQNKMKDANLATSSFSILNQQAAISLKTQLEYARNGHAALRSFLPNKLIQHLRSELLPHTANHALSAWRQKVEVQMADSSDLYHRKNARSIANNLGSIEECRVFLESLGINKSDLPFLQNFNTWRAAPTTDDHLLPTVTKLCLSPYLAQTASILLNSPTVRLYQDSLFHKRPGDGWTPWHSDARMAPFDTSKMITFWIPLQNVPALDQGGTGLLFVDGSHSDFALPYWNGVEGKEYERLEERYGSEGDEDGGVSNHMPLAVGDITVHNGWTLHCAEAAEFLEVGKDRYAFAITYVDGRAEVREDVLSNESNDDSIGNGHAVKGDKEDVWSFRSWLKDVKPRSQFRHPLVPIVWPPEQMT